MGKVYFVGGIDTDIGKTVAVGLMARHLMKRKVRVITAKLVQTGNAGVSEDLLRHRRLMGVDLLPEDRAGLTAPAIFRFPSSPHLAARLENRLIDLEQIRHAIRMLAERHDVVLVEGAGGLAVPLNDDLLTLDFVAQEHWPLILVTSGRLGSINHSILSLEAAAARHLPVMGLVYNTCTSADPMIVEDTRQMLSAYLVKTGRSPVVVVLPRIDPDQPTDIDFQPLFGV